MSIPDANRLSGSPVLRSPEQEIALSAVICTHNRYDLLPEAIEPLVKEDVPADLFEIIVVDNSLDQGGAARFGQRYSGLSNLTYHLAASSPLSMTTHALPLPRPKNCSTLMPHLTAERGS
jgi:hypothetical protein